MQNIVRNETESESSATDFRPVGLRKATPIPTQIEINPSDIDSESEFQ